MSCCASCAGGGGECTAPVPSIVGVELYGFPDADAAARADRERGRGFFGAGPRYRRRPAGYVAPPSSVNTSRGAVTPEQARAARETAAAAVAAPELPGPKGPPVQLRLPPVAFAQAFRATSRGAARAVAPVFRSPPAQFATADESGELLDVGALVAAAEAGDEDALAFLWALLSDEALDGAQIAGGLELPREVRAVDDVLSQVWEAARPFVPYSEQIDTLHRARQAAMYGADADQRGARQGAPGRAPRGGARQEWRTAEQLAAPGRIIAPRTPGGGVRVTPPAGLSPEGKGAVAGIQRVVRDAARGDEGARAELVRLKEGAARGDASARRRWAAAVAVMRDDDARVETRYRARMGAA